MITVFIIEDLPEYRESVLQLINNAGGYVCTGVFNSFEAFKNRKEEEIADVILCDINLPGISGIEGVKYIKSLYPHTEVIMLTVYDDSHSVFQSLRNGASGYILKTDDPKHILDAIDEVLNGGAPMSMSIARLVAESFRKQDNELLLTEQQILILSKLSEGKSYQAIANDMFIGKSTVKYHIKNIYQKLHVKNKVGAVLRATRDGLI